MGQGDICKNIFCFVVFNNDKCIIVLNANLTCQNIMAEGIIQILGKLKSISICCPGLHGNIQCKRLLPVIVCAFCNDKIMIEYY